MKKLNYLFFIIWLSLIPWSSALGTVGFGVQGGQSIFDASSKSSKDGVDLTTSEFANPFSGGVYLYIDVIPFIDLEADISLSAKKYSFIFSPLAGYNDIGPYDFVWADFSIYLTAGEKIVGIGIPLLAKAKLFYGGGINMNTVTPVMDLDLMEDILGEDLTNDPANFPVSEKDLIDFLDHISIEGDANVNLEEVARAAAFLVKTEYGASAKNDFIKSFKFYRNAQAGPNRRTTVV